MSFPPPTPVEQATPARIKPGKRWYWIGGILLAVGIIGGIAIGAVGVVRLVNTVDDFGRFKVEGGSGQASVNFAKSGKYSIYYESQSRVCADLTQSTSDCRKTTVSGTKNPPPGLQLSLSNASGSLTIKDSSRSFDYDFGDFRGQEIATVQVDQPGTYTMTVESQGSRDFVIALGKGIVSSVLPWLVVAALVGLLGLVLGLVAIIVTAVKRGRRKREARAAAAGGYGPYGTAVAPAPYYGTTYPPTQTYGTPVPGSPAEGYASPAPSPYAPEPSSQPTVPVAPVPVPVEPTVPVPVPVEPTVPVPVPVEPTAEPVPPAPPPTASPTPPSSWAPPPPPPAAGAPAPAPGTSDPGSGPGSPLPPPPPPGRSG